MANDIGEREHDRVRRTGQRDIEVSTDGIARLETSFDVPAAVEQRLTWDQARLELAGALEIRGQLADELLVRPPGALQLEAPLQECAQHAALERLEKKIESAFFEGAIEFFVGLGNGSGDEDNVRLRALPANFAAQSVAVSVA